MFAGTPLSAPHERCSHGSRCIYYPWAVHRHLVLGHFVLYFMVDVCHGDKAVTTEVIQHDYTAIMIGNNQKTAVVVFNLLPPRRVPFKP